MAANTETATKSRNLWKTASISTVCPQIIDNCGQIKVHVHNVVRIVAATMKVTRIVAVPIYSWHCRAAGHRNMKKLDPGEVARAASAA